MNRELAKFIGNGAGQDAAGRVLFWTLKITGRRLFLIKKITGRRVFLHLKITGRRLFREPGKPRGGDFFKDKMTGYILSWVTIFAWVCTFFDWNLFFLQIYTLQWLFNVLARRASFRVHRCSNHLWGVSHTSRLSRLPLVRCSIDLFIRTVDGNPLDVWH